MADELKVVKIKNVDNIKESSNSVIEKRCWYNIGSPPPATSKNDVLKFLSVNTIVIPI